MAQDWRNSALDATAPAPSPRARSLFCVLAALVTVACNSSLAPPQPAAHADGAVPRRGGTLHLGSIADVRSLDPAINSDALAAQSIESIFAGLVDFDQAGTVVPDLAARVEVADGGLVYRFFLREGARFQDGEEVTADDVRRSIERALYPGTPNPYASLFGMIDGFADFASKKAPHLRGVAVEGRYVVSVRLGETDARFLSIFARENLRPVCKSAGDHYSDTWEPCGAGPFKIAPGGWDKGRSLTLVRHDGYFRPGRPYLDGVVLTFNLNRVAELYKFEDGDLDATHDLGEGDIQAFRRDPRWSPFMQPEPDHTIYGEVLNNEIPPFDNVEVRRAVAAAIDRDQLRLYRPSSFTVAGQVLPPAVPGFDPHFEGQQRYDYQAALGHMARAGYAYDPVTKHGGYPGVIPYYATREGATEYTFQILQQQLGRIGLRLEGHLVNWGTFLSLVGRRKTVAMSSPGWSMDYPDPADFFEALFSSEAINDEQSTNYAFYRNREVDDLIVRGRHEQDRDARFALYARANRIVCDEAPWAFTFSTRFYDVWQPYVRGFSPHPVWSFYIGDTWLDRTEGAKTRALGMLRGIPGLGHRAM